MRVLICGDRNWKHSAIIETFVAGLFMLYGKQLVVIEGEAQGADLMARYAAEKHLPEENILKFPADWKKYNKGAGPIRNKQMIDEGQPDLVIGFHHDIENSKGTRNMLTQAKNADIPTWVVGHFDGQRL